MKRPIILSLLTLSFTAQADPLTLPNAQQRLPEPIEIPACNLTILEWRRGLFSGTAPSQLGIKRLTDICTTAIRVFPKFLSAERLQAAQDVPFHAFVSIMPYDIGEDGMLEGNLNDDVRFKSRTKFYADWGRELSLYGYFDREEGYIYLRNDVFSADFRKVFSHEMFHMLSDQLGLYDSYYASHQLKDEVNARKFTKFLGLGE